MPRERREILLSQTELVDAVRSYRRMHPDALPAGEIIAVEVERADSLKVTILMKYGDSEQKADFAFSGTRVIEVLIRFCSENNIPIPRSGKKSLQINAGELSLKIELSQSAVTQDEPAIDGPKAAAAAAPDKDKDNRAANSVFPGDSRIRPAPWLQKRTG